jgi:hypothetical protein
MEYKRLNRFKGIDTSEESTDSSEQTLRYAENVVLRPRGAVSRMPPYRKLWNLQNVGTHASVLGINPQVDKTCILSVTQPSPAYPAPPTSTVFVPAVFLIAYDFKNNKGLGIFSAVDVSAEDSRPFTEMVPDYVGYYPPQFFTVLKKGLAENKRWFFYRFYDSIVMGNGVDENLIYQHARTSLRLRTMGSNAQPGIPIVTSGQATTTPTKQASASIDFAGTKYNAPPRPLAEAGVTGTPATAYIKVKWTPADTATEYEADLATTPSFTTPTTITTTDSSIQFESLNFSSLYYFRVRAKFGTNISGNSSTSSIRTNAATQTSVYNQGSPSATPYDGESETKTTLIVTAGTSFIGEAGNNLQIEFVASGNTLISSRTGEGTPTSTLVYTVRGVGTASLQEVLTYIAADEIVQDILTVRANPQGAVLTDLAARSLIGGVGDGQRTGYPLSVNGQIATSFYDPGAGDQGFSSGLSVPVLVKTNSFTKIVTPGSNTTGELARFTKFRIWYRQPTPNTQIQLPANTWLLLGECDNSPSATFEAKLPAKLDDKSVYFDGTDIQRLPPCTMFELCEDKLFASGNPANPTRLWYSVRANKTELVPEGFNLEKNYIEMGARKEEGSGTQITHLKAMDQRLQVHTSRGITLVHGSTFVRTFARSDFGALNPSAATAWSHHISPYLGADGVLYEMSNQQALKSGIASAASWDYIRSFADTAEMQRNPWRANVAGDLTNQLVWVWLPCKIDGITRLAGFLFDYETKGFAGPITWPGLISTTKLSAVDPRIVGQTEAGDLIFIDSSEINKDEYQPNELLTGNFLAVSPNELIFQTQLMDFGVPHEQKAYLELMFNVVRGSFAENIKITLETDEGRSKVFNYGLLRGERNKCAFMLSGYSVRLTFEVTLNANRPFVLRDLVLGYDRQKIR